MRHYLGAECAPPPPTQVTNFDIPHDFPADFVPVFGMDVTTCLEFYSSRYASHAWGDVGAVASDVAAAKEPIYQQLTAGGIAPFPGVRELVAQARALGLGVAVASSGSPDKIAHNLGSSGLADLFDPRLVVSAKHVARGKPAPDVFLEALARLGCSDASRALVVEDAGVRAWGAEDCCCPDECSAWNARMPPPPLHHVGPRSERAQSCACGWVLQCGHHQLAAS